MCMIDDWSWADEVEEEYPIKCSNCECACTMLYDCERCDHDEAELDTAS